MSNLRKAAQQGLEALEDPWKAGAEGVADAIVALRAALRNEFNPDWDQVEALQESLREHMAEIQRLRAMLAVPQPLEPDIAKIVNDNLWNLYVEEPAEPVQSFEDQQRAVNAGDHRRADAVEEPVAWRTFDGEGSYDYRSYEDNEDYIYQFIKRNGGKYADWVEPLYTAPPQRKPLTDEEIINIGKEAHAVEGPHILPVTFARAIERAHGIR